MNMRAYIGGVLMITDGDGDVIENPVVYANILHNMSCNDEWIIIGERNKDRIFHVHTIARCNVRVDSYKRTLMTCWRHVQTSTAFIDMYGSSTLDMIKGQKAHKVSALLQYMCKAPEWIASSSERLLQYTYDVINWDLCARFRGEPEPKPDIDKANPMIQEILQCIMEHSCKTVEEVMRKGSDIVVKHLHKAGLNSIIQNCLTYAKCTGQQWSLRTYGSYNPDPSGIHGCLLTQGIICGEFDHVFWLWITKRHAKRNTIHVLGPSNTGKSSFIAGLGKCCPGGEVVNGNSFNFEGLVEQYWGKWEEPLCSLEMVEKFKQIAEGMETAIPIKFKKPYMLPRTPIWITTNNVIWTWCRNAEAPLRNRMWFYEFNYDMSDGIFNPRATEPSCECRYCEISRGGTPRASSSTASGVPRTKQSTQKQLASRVNIPECTVGSGSMQSTGGGSTAAITTGISGGESSSNTATGSSTSTTISDIHGSDTKYGSSNTDERICSTGTGSTITMGTSSTTGCIRSSDGGIRGRGATGRGHVRRASSTDEILSPMVSVGGARSKKPKMEIQIQTEKQQLGGKMATLKVPDRDAWIGYLAYLYRTYEAKITPGNPDLHAYEELNSDSE